VPPHSWTHGQLETIDTCPCCRTSSIGNEYSRRDDELSFSETWSFIKCGECSSIFLHHRPDAASLPLAYSHYYTHASASDEPSLVSEGASLRNRMVQSYLAKRFGIRFPATSRLAALLIELILPVRMLLDMYGRHVPRDMCSATTRLLDIGCGNGAYLLRAREMGITAMGCEPDIKAAEACRRQELDVIHGDAFDERLVPGSFDIITMHHVIEHVADPTALLSRAHSLLKPGGRLWLGLPNPQSLSLRLFGRSWKGFHPPFHLIIPTQSVLQRWLLASGFNSSKAVRRGMQSRGLWRMSETLFKREEGRNPKLSTPMRTLVDMAATLSPKYGEESVVVATKAQDDV